MMTFLRIWVCGAVLASAGASAASTQEGSLPSFAECMAQEMAIFEQALQVFAPSKAQLDGVPPVNVQGIEFCGTVGIVTCDRSNAPLGCQNALAVEQDILRARVLDQLPVPPSDTPGVFVDRLYKATYALAYSKSAGLDCAGATPRMEMWCRAREANGRLRAAVMAWQVARAKDLVPSAMDAGWVTAPAPLRPRARP